MTILIKKGFYIVNNAFGGCHHKHKTVQAAESCRKRMDRKYQDHPSFRGSFDICRIEVRGSFEIVVRG
jgi:hypothetical protein